MFYILIAMGVIMAILYVAIAVYIRYMWANKARFATQVEAALANASVSNERFGSIVAGAQGSNLLQHQQRQQVVQREQGRAEGEAEGWDDPDICEGSVARVQGLDLVAHRLKDRGVCES